MAEHFRSCRGHHGAQEINERFRPFRQGVQFYDEKPNIYSSGLDVFGGQLKSIHVPSPTYRELRHLTQLRDVLVSELAGMKQRIKSLLLFEGIEFPPAPPGSQWSFLVKDKLRKLACSGTVRFKLDQLLDSLEFNEKQVLKAIREIRRYCQNDPELSQCMKYLMTLPGIGWITASQLLARIGDWRELNNIRQLGGFLGLVPTEHSTGERTDRGPRSTMKQSFGSFRVG